MTAAIPEGLEPIGVWDLANGPLFHGQDNWEHLFLDACFWWADHIDDDGSTYRAEFYVLDAPFAILRKYKRNASGHKYQDPATGRAAVEPQPVIVPLAELPPPHLLGR